MLSFEILEDRRKEAKLKKVLQELRENAFVTTIEDDGIPYSHPHQIEDMDDLIKIQGEWHREDLKRILEIL